MTLLMPPHPAAWSSRSRLCCPTSASASCAGGRLVVRVVGAGRRGCWPRRRECRAEPLRQVSCRPPLQYGGPVSRQRANQLGGDPACQARRRLPTHYTLPSLRGGPRRSPPASGLLPGDGANQAIFPRRAATCFHAAALSISRPDVPWNACNRAEPLHLLFRCCLIPHRKPPCIQSIAPRLVVPSFLSRLSFFGRLTFHAAPAHWPPRQPRAPGCQCTPFLPFTLLPRQSAELFEAEILLSAAGCPAQAHPAHRSLVRRQSLSPHTLLPPVWPSIRVRQLTSRRPPRLFHTRPPGCTRFCPAAPFLPAPGLSSHPTFVRAATT